MIQRVFLGWDRPLLRTAADYLAQRFIRAGVLDLRDHVIGVPGGRSGRRIRERLLEASEAAEARFVPPRIIRIGSLPELFYGAALPFAPPIVVRRLWSVLLSSERREITQRIFGQIPEAAATSAWDALGAEVARLQREVGGGGYGFRDVAGACERGSDLLFDDAERWHLLAGLQERYASALGKLGYADQDLARIDALSAERVGIETPVWLLGLAELPAIAGKLLERSGGSVTALIHAPESEAAAFDRFGAVIPAVWMERDLSVGAEHIRIIDRPGDQAAAAAHEISMLPGASLEDVVVGVTDESLVPYVEEWLEAAGAPVHYGGGLPVTRTAPYRLLAAIAEFLEKRDWESFAALVRHPDLERAFPYSGPGAHDQLLARIDKHFGRHLTAVVQGRQGNAPESQVPLPPGSSTVEGNRLLGSLAGTKPLQDWSESLLNLLVAIYGGRKLDPLDPDSRCTIEVLKKFKDAAVAAHELPAPLGERCTAPVAIRIILAELSGTAIAEEAERAAIDLLGWLEVAADDTPHVFVLGVNEPMLPQSVNADPFLPDRLRSVLGILDNARRYARDAFHVEALVHSRVTTRFISGRLSAEGDPLRPSRLMLAATGPELAERVLAFTHAGASVTPTPPLVAGAGKRSAFPLPPRQTLAVEVPEKIYVTTFRDVLKDPYRYVLEKQLGLRSFGDEARELDGGVFGDLAHRVLTRFGRSALARSTDGEAIQRMLSESLDEEAAKQFGAASFPAVRIQVEQLRLRLARFSEWQTQRCAAGWEIVLVEGRPVSAEEPEEPDLATTAELIVDGGPVTISGRIDRIDYHPATGRWALLDYKTSDKAETPDEKHRSKKGWKDLQLPLYRHLARAIQVDGRQLIPENAEVELGYILLCRDLERSCDAPAEWDETQLEEADETAREVIRTLRQGTVDFQGIRDNGYPDDPMGPLLGSRQLIAIAEQPEDDEEVPPSV